MCESFRATFSMRFCCWESAACGFVFILHRSYLGIVEQVDETGDCRKNIGYGSTLSLYKLDLMMCLVGVWKDLG